MSADPVDVEGLRDRVHAALEHLLERQAAVLDGVSPDLVPALEPVRHLLLGGKRLRPAFCYWGWRGAGGAADDDGIVQVAAALELFHVAALIHDDVMDGSDTRRGRPAVHRSFAALHADHGWQGSSDHFGTAGAILTGDLCLSWCDEAYAGAPLPADRLAAGRAVFDRMKTELMCGQYLDMLGQVQGSTSVERARRVIFFKSSKYSIQEPLLLGGALAGGTPELLTAYETYGEALGEAFQLRDDVLGVFGDPATTGKPAGDDLREGKRTVLVGMALERSSPVQADELLRGLGNPDLDAAGVDRIRAIMTENGALDAVESLVKEQSDRALASLGPVPAPARDVLADLVAAATARTL